jgi:hypothetical protein
MTTILRRTLLAGAIVAVVGFAVIGVAAAAGPATAPVTGTPAGTLASTTSTDPVIAGTMDALLAADQVATPERLRAPELRRLAAWRRLVHATATLDLPAFGGLTTVQLDHGTLSAVRATSLTIGETGGTSVTVELGAATKVRRDGAETAIADLKVGDDVFVMSRVETGGAEAYLVVVPQH